MTSFDYWGMKWWAKCNLEDINKKFNTNFAMPSNRAELYDLAYHKWYWLEEKEDYEEYIPFKDYMKFLENLK